MNRATLLTVAAAALLVLSGCSGVLPVSDDGPSDQTYPAASEINQTLLDQHSAQLQNTSFTVIFAKTDERPSTQGSGTDTQFSRERVLVDTENSEYLAQPNGTSQMLGTTQIEAVYSNGTVTYQLQREDNQSSVRQVNSPIFNESSGLYLWQGWREIGTWAVGYQLIHENTSFERLGTETFDGVEVMRYEADGIEALPPADQGMDGNYGYREFSMTILLDKNGVIRHYQAEVDFGAGEMLHNQTIVQNVTDVGTTTVDKPAWVTNASDAGTQRVSTLAGQITVNLL